MSSVVLLVLLPARGGREGGQRPPLRPHELHEAGVLWTVTIEPGCNCTQLADELPPEVGCRDAEHRRAERDHGQQVHGHAMVPLEDLEEAQHPVEADIMIHVGMNRMPSGCVAYTPMRACRASYVPPTKSPRTNLKNAIALWAYTVMTQARWKARARLFPNQASSDTSGKEYGTASGMQPRVTPSVAGPLCTAVAAGRSIAMAAAGSKGGSLMDLARDIDAVAPRALAQPGVASSTSSSASDGGAGGNFPPQKMKAMAVPRGTVDLAAAPRHEMSAPACLAARSRGGASGGASLAGPSGLHLMSRAFTHQPRLKRPKTSAARSSLAERWEARAEPP
eukprot:CAMPEP_0175586626 /NCGR_PEP_ID=MMETSP0096-20121207/50334_1 /TAXON_ID=311494 /ORGANISM="Alexandrium monilatum, Strain CCMP3105" /LENGTH=335 /DNA_ID=CAMNT_0016890505 /DNA_START=15 /DNA_END=1020 /DNA_ORIENTATION=-